MNENEKKFSFARFYQRYGTLVVLVIVFTAAALISRDFLKLQNMTNVLRQITVISVLGCGCCFVLISGNINIAYDGLIACLGCTACLVMAATQSIFLAVTVAVAAGAIIGYLYGCFVTVFQIPGFIVGLAVSSIASGAILLITGGDAVPKASLGNFSVLGQGYIGPVPICVIILLIALVICHIILKQTCFGRKVNAVGGNRTAALTSGINVNRVIRQVFVLDGVLCAIGAVLYMSRINSGQPSGGTGYCFDAITAVCVGGVSIQGGSGGVVGTLIGGAIVGILNNLLNLMNISSDIQDIVSGIVIILAVTADIAVKNSVMKTMKKS